MTATALRGAALLDEGEVDEVIHEDTTARLRLEHLLLPGDEDAPPLVVERSVRPEGPTRPPVLLVHGFAQNRYTWRVSRRSFSGALAAAGHDVFNLELRGHGLSRAQGAPNATRFDEYVEDIARLAQAIGTPPFAIGHSLGAAAVVGASTRTPLRGVVHLGGVFTFATGNPTLRALARLTRRLEPALLASPARLRTSWAGEVLGRLYRLTDIAGFGLPLAGWVPGSIERDLLEERLELGFDWFSVEVWLQMARWAGGEPFAYAEPFGGVDVPLLVISGDHDVLARPRDGQACYDGSGSSDREFLLLDAFEHQVHWGHLDLILGHKAPEEVWPRIADWLSQRSA